jgi:S1/P1 nuclease
MNRGLQLRFCVAIFAFWVILPPQSTAWNHPGHMLNGVIAYRILQRESPATISTVRSILQMHPWYESPWREELGKLPQTERDEMLFMLAARWADDIRTRDRAESRPPWHYINWPSKPEGEPTVVETKPPEQENILTAMAENKRLARSAGADQRAIAVAWLFHLAGDLHQPLHTIAMFTREYPNGDRGGNQVCVRVAPNRVPLALHRLWDALVTSSNNAGALRNLATELRARFPRAALTELVSVEPEAWAKESFEIAVKIAYQNGALRGTPKGQRKDCRDITDAQVLPNGYLKTARQIADRRMIWRAIGSRVFYTISGKIFVGSPLELSRII